MQAHSFDFPSARTLVGSLPRQPAPPKRMLGVCTPLARIENHDGRWIGYAEPDSPPLELGERDAYACIDLDSLAGRYATKKGGIRDEVCCFGGVAKINAIYAFEAPSYLTANRFLLPRAYLTPGLTCVLDCEDTDQVATAWAFRFALENGTVRTSMG